MEQAVTKERQLHMDLLRIFACFSVLMLHTASQFWYTLPVQSAEWIVSNVYDSAFRFGVPIFVMISGRFFLSRPGEIDVRKLYSKHILRLLVAYGVWSLIYGIWDCRFWMGNEGVGWKVYVTEVLMGRYHLWYLPMLIGIYILLPVLKSWVMHCSKKNMEYFLIMFGVLQIGFSTVKILYIPASVLEVIYQFDNVEMVCSYVGYFVLGYYLYRYPLSKKAQKWVYAGGVLGLMGAIGVSTLDALRRATPVSTAFDSFSIFTFGVTLAVYVFFQEVLGKKSFKKGEKLIKEVSANTFGIYLMHLWFVEYLGDKGITTMSVNIALGIPLLAVVCFLVCALASALLRRIPFIGKYIC